jgi:hypothetical protein
MLLEYVSMNAFTDADALLATLRPGGLPALGAKFTA